MVFKKGWVCAKNLSDSPVETRNCVVVRLDPTNNCTEKTTDRKALRVEIDKDGREH